jgi:hypothetical protein
MMHVIKSKKTKKNKRRSTHKKQRKQSKLRKRSHHKRSLRKQRIRGGNVDQETTKTLELVPIESDETAMIAGPGFSMNAEEYEAMMERLDRDGSDY